MRVRSFLCSRYETGEHYAGHPEKTRIFCAKTRGVLYRQIT
uniref:Uncharacterized protein n=1 Tax=Faecalibaculum rodentium TaxID=1702221 RepID=A0A140DSU4_9FIRM|nr:hypothetical protein AALO17_05870 [Faecalibaculum rodentium]